MADSPWLCVGIGVVPTAVFAGGALLFLFSNTIFILNTFWKETKQSLWITSIFLYYVVQLLIAMRLNSL